jgi:adenylate cyclase
MKLRQKFQRNGVRIGLNVVVLVVFLVHASGLLPLPFIGFVENYAYDVRMLASMEPGQDPRIVIVDIDERSLAEDGRWPWSRNRMAQLLDNLFDRYGAALVGFDVVFAEPDDSSGLGTLERLAREELAGDAAFRERLESLREQLDYDRIFARSMNGRPVVLGYYFSVAGVGSADIRSGLLPDPVFDGDEFPTAGDIPEALGYGANLPELQRSAAGAGHFNPSIDADGIVRRVPMLQRHGGDLYESLSLAMARRVLDAGRIEPVFATDVAGNYLKLEALRLGRTQIPVDAAAQALVTYRGRKSSFPYLSASDVLHGRVDPVVLEDAIVLVGTSAPGLFDLRATPVQNKYPGVEIHANVIAGILDNDIRHRPAWALGVEFVNILVAGVAIILSVPFLAPLWSMVFAAMLMVGSIGLNFTLWQAGIVVPIAATLAMILIQFVVNMSYGFFFERRNKSQITDLFGQYVPPELVEEMSEDPAAYIPHAEERELTVLFSDVRGFTTLSEGLSPKELSDLMNEFLTQLTAVIHRHRGTIDKYMGDAIMAFWGAPVRDELHARHALMAGLAMVEKMYALQDEFEKRGWPRLAIGVGINTGIMSVGNMGSKFRTAYTVIGDEVNLGSRLEGLTKQYGVDIIVGENVARALPDYVFRELDLVRVKGKHRPIAIYEPLADESHVSVEEHRELERHGTMLAAYRAQRWDEAEVLLGTLKQEFGARHLYDMYLERIAYFRRNPPGPDWDGVFVFTVK